MDRRNERLERNFFEREVLVVAEDLIGRELVRKFEDGREWRGMITETEAYGGEEDLASHARFGRTGRNQLMYGKAGVVYVYLIYGMYWMLNIITGEKNRPEGVLIRGVEGVEGPGRVGKRLELDRSFYGEDLTKSRRIWFEKGERRESVKTKRIGIGYAGIWQEKLWRFVMK